MTWTSTQDIIAAERDHGMPDIMLGVATGSVTAGGVNSGIVSANLLLNASGSTLWSTLKGFPVLSPVADSRDVRVLSMRTAAIREITYWLARIYKLGTVDPTATGQRFTHHSATFPVTRTRRGAAQPVRGFPLMLVTTTTSTTAFVIDSLKYKNEAGATITGAKTFTMPATNTAQGTGLILDLEDGDQAITDIEEVNIGTSAAAGACSIYLVEPILMCSQLLTGHATEADAVRGQRFCPPAVQPGVPTAGTLETELVIVGLGTNATNTGVALVRAVEQL